jgi:Xaa-Pro aminopeptidase
MRMIKDEEEIKFIKKACEITDLGFNYILNFIKEGVRECEISLELEYFLKKNFNIQKLAFPVIVAGGSNSAIPHYPTGDYKIRYGDCILIDFGVIFSNYCSDLTRTVFLGKIDSEKKKIYYLVKDSQKIAIEKIREGERCKNVEKVVREYFKEKGFNKYFIHNLGHGLGRQVHEFPSISSKDKTILNSGMVFTIEPGLYFPGKYGIRIEDVVLINKKEVELITKSEKNILVI